MKSYTADDIREAYIALGRLTRVGEQLIEKLDEMKYGNHFHDFADDDMITVKEIREAWVRGSSTSARNSLEHFLRDISEHREPEYPPNTIWEDKSGVAWLRVHGKKWLRFGYGDAWGDEIPRRPLRQLK